MADRRIPGIWLNGGKPNKGGSTMENWNGDLRYDTPNNSSLPNCTPLKYATTLHSNK